jgi:hypothetical protein
MMLKNTWCAAAAGAVCGGRNERRRSGLAPKQWALIRPHFDGPKLILQYLCV